MNRFTVSKWIALFALLLTQSLTAGSFHYYLDVTTALQVDGKQQLNAIKMSWVYDEKMTGMMLKNEQDLKGLGDVIISDLHKLNYFTKLSVNRQPVNTGKVQKHSLELLKQAGKNKLKLNFTLPLQTPVSLKGKKMLSIDLVDRAGSAILYHKDASRILLGQSLKSFCKALVVNKEEFEHNEAAQVVTLNCNMP